MIGYPGFSAAALLLIVALVAFFPKARTPAPRAIGGYRPKVLLSAWERRVLADLRPLLPPHLHLCPQVRLGDAFGTTGGSDEQRRAFWRIAAKSVDFLLVDIRTGAVRLGIELNDRTHQQDKRRARDVLVADVFAQAGIPLLCVAPFTPIDLTPYLT